MVSIVQDCSQILHPYSSTQIALHVEWGIFDGCVVAVGKLNDLHSKSATVFLSFRNTKLRR